MFWKCLQVFEPVITDTGTHEQQLFDYFVALDEAGETRVGDAFVSVEVEVTNLCQPFHLLDASVGEFCAN